MLILIFSQQVIVYLYELLVDQFFLAELSVLIFWTRELAPSQDNLSQISAFTTECLDLIFWTLKLFLH